MAGESASEVARRQREKVGRLERSAALWEQGAAGERATAEALDLLPPEAWTVLHDRRWPGRQLANVDHVAIGPGGVFVIDSKNWSGRVTVDKDVLRQNGRSREKSVAGAADAALAIAALLRRGSPIAVVPVLCFVRDEPLSGWARDVMVCSTSNVTEMLLSRPHVVTADQVRAIGIELDLALRSAAEAGPAPAPRPQRDPASPPSRRTSPPAPRARRKTRRSSKGSPGGQLVRLLLVAGVVIGAVKLGATDWVAEKVADELTTQPVPPTDENLQQKKDEKRERQGKNNEKDKPGADGIN